VRVKKSVLEWVAVLALAAGFGGATATSASAADSKENWGHYCARCHGPDGTGNTKMGRKLRIKDLSSEKMQTKLRDEEIVDIIVDGNQEENGKDGMPSFKEKLTPDERQALAAYIRTLKK
jgi:mono/diheme cytochrome c family protein